LPKDRIWIEQLFSYLPINMDSLTLQMALRFALLLSIWLSGLLVHSLDGLTMDYIYDIWIYQSFFGPGFIVLFGSYMIQKALPDTIASFKALVDLDEPDFQRLTARIKRYSFSLAPCVLLALIFVFTFMDVPRGFQLMMLEGIKLHIIWETLFIFFMYLLVGTGVWMGVSIWLTVILISRQPLKVELSPGLIDNFRGLNMLALWFSLFYFLAISIGVAVSMVGSPALSILEIVFSPFLIFIGIGVVSVLFPFYNIHKALLRLKRNELEKISKEFESIRSHLDEALKFPEAEEARLMTAMGRLLSLQLRERKLREAPEWPIDIGFVSRLLSLVLIPAVVRISIELFNRAFIK
jgi:hypothetical protein